MIEPILISNHVLLLKIQIKTNQFDATTLNVYKNKKILSQKPLPQINMLVTQHKWMNCMNISEIIWKIFQSKPYRMDQNTSKSCQELLVPQFYHERHVILCLYKTSWISYQTLPNCYKYWDQIYGEDIITGYFGSKILKRFLEVYIVSFSTRWSSINDTGSRSPLVTMVGRIKTC